MQYFEIVFLAIFSISVIRLVIGPKYLLLKYSYITGAGFLWIAVFSIIEGWRWQMYPAVFGFLLLALFSAIRSGSGKVSKFLSAASLVVLLCLSTFLSYQIPIAAMPKPSGPYGVGNLDYTIVDNSRAERWALDRNRELYVEVWYPSEIIDSDTYPVRTLHQELYEGEYDIWSFLFGYLENTPTNSFRNAPMLNTNERFPVLIFNHGADGYTSQNLILMEHLASNGYVILSVAHPYQSLKVHLQQAGTVTLTSERPKDTGFDVNVMERSLYSKMYREYDSDPVEASAIRKLLFSLSEQYANAVTVEQKQLVITNALKMDEMQPYEHLMTRNSLEEYLRYIWGYQHRQIEYWVEDVQFVADTAHSIETGIPGLDEMLDTNEFGVLGMSFGGAAAGEFCKIDSRCKVGINLDGTQFGRHWNMPLIAPFLMLTNENYLGGNDFAYMPAIHEYQEFAIQGSSHIDFVDIAYTHPIVKTLGLGGDIEGERILNIINELSLDFLNRHLKSKTEYIGEYSHIPELVAR